jgi:hypothetical protein
MRTVLLSLIPLLAFASIPEAEQSRKTFNVKQVIAGSVYLDGGSIAGLSEGMRLTLERRPPGAAKMSVQTLGELVVVSVATQSALCEVKTIATGMEPMVGDLATLSSQDAETVLNIQAASKRKKYAQVISFTSGDPLEEEVRAYVPAPPLSEVGRFRGQIGFEFNTLSDRSSGLSSHQEGMVLRVDYTRIGGTYWNLTGYWRGVVSSRQGGVRQQTLLDLINRTYQIGLFYNNPASRFQIGIGRLYLPWAASLSTIDGGYAAMRAAKHVTVGVFAGSTPDPTQWDYNPNRQMLGVFTNFDAGSYEHIKWSGTFGAAVTRVDWRPERQFIFTENSFFLGSRFSVLHSLEADERNPVLMNGQTGPVLSRSFLTVRYQASQRIIFDVNHNYFRGIPTFDLRLIGTGLLDRMLFQGFSGGVRVMPLQRLILTANLGESRREGDSRQSLNQLYGVTYTRLPWIQARLDVRYSRFASSFGTGSYRAVSLMRELRDTVSVEVSVGEQDLLSVFTKQSQARFVNGQVNWNVGRHLFLTSGYLSYFGQLQDYSQLFVTMGYRY